MIRLGASPWSRAGHVLFPKDARNAVSTTLLIFQRLTATCRQLEPAAAKMAPHGSELEATADDVARTRRMGKKQDGTVLPYLPPELVLFLLSFLFRGDYGNLAEEATFHVDLYSDD